MPRQRQQHHRAPTAAATAEYAATWRADDAHRAAASVTATAHRTATSGAASAHFPAASVAATAHCTATATATIPHLATSVATPPRTAAQTANCAPAAQRATSAARPAAPARRPQRLHMQHQRALLRREAHLQRAIRLRGRGRGLPATVHIDAEMHASLFPQRHQTVPPDGQTRALHHHRSQLGLL